MKSLSLMVQIPWNPMKSHVFLGFPPVPSGSEAPGRLWDAGSPSGDSKNHGKYVGNGKFYGMKYEKLWENMGKYIYLYIYMYINIYIYFDVQYWFHVSLFFRMVHGFPIYIYLICHMLMICCQSPTWMVIQVATNVDGFCLFFRTHPDVLR
jgi:hypothetical protein